MMQDEESVCQLETFKLVVWDVWDSDCGLLAITNPVLHTQRLTGSENKRG